jgi:hypothetical protein
VASGAEGRIIPGVREVPKAGDVGLEDVSLQEHRPGLGREKALPDLVLEPVGFDMYPSRTLMPSDPSIAIDQKSRR